METATQTTTDPLPRCEHDNCLQDGSGELLEPPCGCRLPAPQETPARHSPLPWEAFPEKVIVADPERARVVIRAANSYRVVVDDNPERWQQALVDYDFVVKCVNRDPAFQKLVEAAEAIICQGCGNRIGWQGEHSKYGNYKNCSSCKPAREALHLARQGE